MPRIRSCLAAILFVIAASGCADGVGSATSLALAGGVDHVQPFTGIVLWSDNPEAAGAYKSSIQLEFSYVRFDSVSKAKGAWDWSPVDALLADIASRGHQAIIRFRYEYPGEAFGLPAWIEAEPGYARRSVAVTDGGSTTSVELPDWSCPALMDFNTEFFRRFAERYDRDARLAYLQVGFGFWSEYHLNIDRDRAEPGANFPSIDYQGRFLKALARFFSATPYSISIDSAQAWGPFAAHPELLALGFGSFDDSFLCEEHETVNRAATKGLGEERWKIAPRGGEFSYYTEADQRLALAPSGPHGASWKSAAAAYRMSYVVGNDQPGYQSAGRVAAAGMAAGYRLAVVSATAGSGATTVVLRNDGVAPLYYDAWPALGGIRSATSLKGLVPGESRAAVIPASPPAGRRDITGLFSIACDRLVAGQSIQFSASLR